MNAQSFLNRLLQTKQRIRSIDSCITFLSNRLNKTTQTLSDLPRTTTPKDTLDGIAEIQAKKSERADLLQQYDRDYHQFIRYTARLEDLEQVSLLFMKYIDGLSDKAIRIELKRSRTKTYHIHNEAINKLNQIMRKEHQKTSREQEKTSKNTKRLVKNNES